ncbi:FtsK/SpoIIIE domain-containing protein [Streptomyces sp. SL13]|uniref:FtsK/SpoIIIE domain-containing protein n=1 Tax=Streptantibioticus silvisoli TaxID=2705255 RepID=A0AA90H4M3_9ACTN|nr:FtsK/SpoIIIE domain-containing protein [Streptantibioticus silvisoli]MDI5971886.1 FtsK/SpoIIIE domain-containing protein [Streptantibioticus silvisoli]
MNHDDEHELFQRLEADMATPDDGNVVDLDKHRKTPLTPNTDDDGDGPAAGVPLVDGPEPTGPGLMDRVRGAQRRRVLPAWVTSKPEFADAAGWLLGHTAHATAFHAVRLPYYAAVLGLRAPAGAAKFVGGTVRWVTDAEGEPLRQAAARREDADEYLRLSRQRDGRVKLRSVLLGLACVVGLPTALALYVLAPEWLLVTATTALTLALGALGAPADKPVVSRAVVATQVERLTSTIVERALGALGIAEINKALGKGGEGIKFPAPITRDGPGWRADVDLPYGVTVTDILDRRDRLASGLRRPLGCVWPEPVADEHAGRMMLWVGDKALNKVKPPVWPLAKSGTASLFQPLPFGTDQRGRAVSVLLMFANVLIGAMPRQGKTFALRVLMLAAALDPAAELHVWELKGTGDLEDAAKVAADYGSGPDDETIEGALGSIRHVYKELERRSGVIRSLSKERRPENKVTPELAADRRLGLHPLVLIVDECQELFSHGKFGKEAGELCEAIIKRGPAMGVILLLATQRPDKDSLPTGISANVGIRFCLRVMGQTENDMVLGTSAYKNGIRATTFTMNDKGIGYLLGAADNPQIVRSYYLDGPAAGRIMDRARAARIAAGTLTGIAAGQAPERETTSSILDDLISIWPAGETKVWSDTLTTALAVLAPERYEGWEPEQLSSALKPHGVTVVQVGRRVDGKVVNKRGFERKSIDAAVTKRDGERSA